MYEKAKFFLTIASLCVYPNLLLADSNEAIEGLWIVGDGLEASTEVIAFTPDGYYFYLSRPDQIPESQTDVEEGKFSWDPESGILEAEILGDENGAKGFSKAVDEGSTILAIPENNEIKITVGERAGFIASKANGRNDSMLGAWIGDFDIGEASAEVIVYFFENNSFISASQIGQSETPVQTSDLPGVEKGTYIWNDESGSLTLEFETDTNPENGLSALQNDSIFLSFNPELGTLEVANEGIVISNMLSLDDFFKDDDDEGNDENLDWIAVETDTINELLNKNGAGYVQIVDGERELLVSYDDGSPIHLSFVHSADDGSGHTMVPFAVAKTLDPDYEYILAVKNTNKYPDLDVLVEYKYWELYKLDSNGSLKNWNDVIHVESGIVAYEETFGQDLDGDMYLGLNLSALISIESDTKNEILKTNEEGEIYILGGVDDKNPILVVRPEGGAALLSDEYQWSWSEEIEGNTALRTQSVSRSPFAVAKQQDGTFSMIYIVNNRLDFKFDNDELNDSYEVETWSEYIVYSVSAEGILDWEEEWTESILDFEPLFDPLPVPLGSLPLSLVPPIAAKMLDLVLWDLDLRSEVLFICSQTDNNVLYHTSMSASDSPANTNNFTPFPSHISTEKSRSALVRRTDASFGKITLPANFFFFSKSTLLL